MLPGNLDNSISVVYLDVLMLSIGNGRFTISVLYPDGRVFIMLNYFELCNTCLSFTFPTSMGCVCSHDQQMKLKKLPHE